MMRIDARKPGLIACLHGDAGLGWLIFSRFGVTVLMFLFVVSTSSVFS
jgi:hypothetical protein